MVVKAELFQISKRRRFDEKIRRRQQLGKNLAIRIVVQIENNAALVRIGVNKSEAALGMLDIASERRHQTVWITAGRFDFYDVGPEIGEPAGRVGCRYVAQFDDTEVAESAIFGVCICQIDFFLSNAEIALHHEAHEGHEGFQ